MLTLSLPLATIVDTVPVPLATKVDRAPSVPLAMIVAVFTNVRGIACFQIFYPQKPGTGSQKIGSERVKCVCVSGTDVVQCYTIVPPSLLGDHSDQQKVDDGRALFMMIKIYRDGLLTPFIGRLRPGWFFLSLVGSVIFKRLTLR